MRMKEKKGGVKMVWLMLGIVGDKEFIFEYQVKIFRLFL